MNGLALVDPSIKQPLSNEVWSQQASAEAKKKSNALAFDGDETTSNQVAHTDGDASIVFSLTPVPVGEAVKIKTRMNGQAGNITCNGTTITDSTNTAVITDCGVTASDTLTIIQSVNTGAGSNDDSSIFYVEIGGRLLVDNDGALAKVEYQTKGGNGTILDVDVATKALKIKNSDDRDERWIAGNKAGTAFCVAGPEIVDDPLLTSNVYLESSTFSTTPETDALGNPLDALETITWSITPDGEAEMIQTAGPSGTQNPYQPTGLSLNTWHTVKVKHKGLLLGESIGPWSNSVRFKTGASRTLAEHYLAQIRDLEKELAVAGAPRPAALTQKTPSEPVTQTAPIAVMTRPLPKPTRLGRVESPQLKASEGARSAKRR